MDITLKLNGVKEIILTPKSENWKQYAELIKTGEKYEVTRENNTNQIILKQIK